MVGKRCRDDSHLDRDDGSNSSSAAYIFSIITPPRRWGDGQAALRQRSRNGQQGHGRRSVGLAAVVAAAAAPHHLTNDRTNNKLNRRSPPSMAPSPNHRHIQQQQLQGFMLPSQVVAAYAGAKFSDPPAPDALPKPPSHWVKKEPGSSNNSSMQKKSSHCSEISNKLKLLLNVQA